MMSVRNQELCVRATTLAECTAFGTAGCGTIAADERSFAFDDNDSQFIQYKDVESVDVGNSRFPVFVQ